MAKPVHGALFLLAYMRLWYVNWVKSHRFHSLVGYRIPNFCIIGFTRIVAIVVNVAAYMDQKMQ